MHHEPEAFVLDQFRNYQIKGKQTKKTQLPSVSKVQYMTKYDDQADLDYFIMACDDHVTGIDPKQKEMMNELVETVNNSNQKDKLLMFLPHGNQSMK